MKVIINKHNQEIFEPLENIVKYKYPEYITLSGKYTIVEPLDIDKHLNLITDTFLMKLDDSKWTYLMFEQPESKEEWLNLLTILKYQTSNFYYVVIDKNNNDVIGLFGLLRCDINSGVIEVGNVIFSHKLVNTRIATEAQYLLASYVFDTLKYRRYEWKCDSLNQKSINAALRLGFKYEGTFIKALIYKGRNRNTSWFALYDDSWPSMKLKLENWLREDNFNDNGQIKRLADC